MISFCPTQLEQVSWGLTKTLTNEFAEKGILVNSVCPGYTLTERVEELARSEAEKTGKPEANVIQNWAMEIPLKRMANPNEISNVVVFLASERASYITGEVIQVDGGWIRSIFQRSMTIQHTTLSDNR